jgi:hypothetical protein
LGQPRTFRTFADALFPYHKVLPRYVLACIESHEISPYFQSVFLAPEHGNNLLGLVYCRLGLVVVNLCIGSLGH